MGSFTAGTIGNGLSLTTGGNLDNFTATSVGAGSQMTVGGSINTLKTTKGAWGASVTAAGGIGTITITGTTAGGDLVGNIVAQGTAGIGTVTVSKGGLSGTLSAGHANSGIKSLTVNGAITAGSSIGAGAGGIGTMTLKGDSSLTIVTPGKVGTVTLTGTLAHPLTVSGIFDVKVISTLNGALANLDGLTVRATDGIGTVNVRSINNSLFSAGTIGNVTTSKDMTGSTLLAGYDIGADYAVGTSGDATFATAKGNIGAIMIGGTMGSSSIAAGIAPGTGLHFGDGDDSVLVSTSLEGAIKSLTVKGALIGVDGSTENFGVVADGTIGSATIGGKKVTLPYHGLIGNVVVQQNWR
jgi:hypothetical protein